MLNTKIATLVFILLIFVTPNVKGVRPFVTDDARIVSKGQIEIETWPEINQVGPEQTYGYQLMMGYSFTEWFELIVGNGIGFDVHSQEYSMGNPTITPKLLFYKTELNSLIPGVALGTGINLNSGSGFMYDEAFSSFWFFIFSWRLLDDWINIHTNLGQRYMVSEQQSLHRSYWGIGFDLGLVHKDYRFIVEAFAGDPFEALSPEVAYQWGFRWLKSDYVNFDLTFGTQAEMHDGQTTGRQEYWVQVGIRLLFDTKFATHPSTEGARGIFP